jgi:hypothetical protein
VVLVSELSNEADAAANVPAQFEIKNASTNKVSLYFRSQSCGCFRVTANGNELSPGNSQIEIESQDRLLISFDVHPKVLVGTQTYDAMFTVGKERSHEIPLRCGLTCLSDFEIDPCSHVCDFTIDKCAPVDVAIQLSCTGRRRVKETEIDFIGLPPYIRLKSISEVDSNRTSHSSGLIKCVFLAVLAVQPLDDQSTGQDSSIRICILGERGTIEKSASEFRLIRRRRFGILAPTKIECISISVGETVARTIEIESADDEPFSIEEAVSDSEMFLIDFKRGVRSKRHWVRVSYSPNSSEVVNGTAVLTLDHVKNPEKRIELVGRVGP